MFGRKKKNREGSGHIKENTFGSSNEISFSVLDAMKSQSSDESSKQSMAGKTNIETGSLDSPIKPKWEYPQQEIDSRKAKRKVGKRWAVILGVLVGLIALSIAGYFAVRAIQHQMDYITRLDDEIATVLNCDEDLDSFKETIDKITTQPIDRLDDVINEAIYRQTEDNTDSKMEHTLKTQERKLQNAKRNIESIQDNLATPMDKERASNALVTINTELDLIECGRNIAIWFEPYADAYEAANQFMTTLLAADDLARQAADLANESTKDSFDSSIEKSREAIARFEEAGDYAAVLRDTTGLDGIQDFIDYVSLRISAQNLAIKADQAYLGINSSQLKSANDEYNATEQRAAELMNTLSQSYPTNMVADWFASNRSNNPEMEKWDTEIKRLDDYSNRIK